MVKKLVGIDVGGTSVKFAIVSLTGEIEQKWTIKTNIADAGSHIVPDIAKSLNNKLLELAIEKDNIVGIGMGTPGSINYTNGTVVNAFNLNWTTVQPVSATLTELTGLPVYLDNDANVAALGEGWQGAGDGESEVVFVTLGTGVGGGVITNGKIVRGIAGAGGEIGHVTVERDGIACTCGKKGCLETIASATGVLNVARQQAPSSKANSTLRDDLLLNNSVSAKAVFDAAKAYDPFAQEVVAYVAQSLGFALSHIGNLLNPSRIVIGGGVSAAGDVLIEPVRDEFEKNVFSTVKQSTKIAVATLGNDAGVIGAASLVLAEQN
ncbi:ROK family glucokinase [Brochothrix campestris]|uniref:Glucokinase n=1 Tax=Brochothrix campestris FSL F6-1037 TaxID=1265861 RepID=W7CTS1_9LIST|nr:ROK family glucokinase [Brochothrix campestris]EUJ40287.1 glucokinase [Brochothrix campestris FSL F6-1037]